MGVKARIQLPKDSNAKRRQNEGLFVPLISVRGR